MNDRGSAAGTVPETGDRLQDLLGTLVRHLVDRPEEVEIRPTRLKSSTIYRLKVAPGDIGRVIGRHGRVIRALRVVLKSVAAQGGTRAELELLE